jgi:CheY-like chemotaxis protein
MSTLSTWRRVLVVDDDPDIRMILGRALREDGLAVDLAADGQEALSRLREQVPQVIVLDLIMPNIGGLDFIETCRAVPGCSAVPIILMSAESTLTAARARLDDKGVVALVHKPFDLDDMLELIRRLARRSASGDPEAPA